MKEQMEKLIIKKLTPNELNLLQEISQSTFYETFAEHNSEEDMRSYLENNLSIKKLKQEILNPNSEFYFVSIDDKVIGYLKINFGHAQTELVHEHSVEIERIYVLKDFHGYKVGQHLFDKAVERAKDINASKIWLGVWENNKRAIKFYENNNFKIFDQHVFRLGNDEQIDWLMQLEL